MPDGIRTRATAYRAKYGRYSSLVRPMISDPMKATMLNGPGDVFVVRLAGNFLDDDGFASLEYAVKFLGAPLVMILGHTNCGAIDEAIKVVKEGIELPGHLPELIKSIEPAVIAAHARHPSDLLAAATEENVRLNMKRLVDNEPIMTEPLAAKKLAIAGGVYDIATGKVNLLT